MQLLGGFIYDIKSCPMVMGSFQVDHIIELGKKVRHQVEGSSLQSKRVNKTKSTFIRIHMRDQKE